MRHVLGVLSAFVVAIGLLSPPAAAQSSSRIVFTSTDPVPDPTAEPHVWKMKEDGTYKQQVTSGRDSNPNLCRDGQNLVFDRGGAIFITSATSPGSPTLVTGSALNSDPDCGRKVAGVYKIVFTRDADEPDSSDGTKDDIYIVNSDGTGLALRYASPPACPQCPPAHLIDYHPAWCGNSHVVFSRQKPSGLYEFEICTMPATSGDPTCHPAPAGVSDRFPSCTLDAAPPNFGKIAFERASAADNSPGEICTMDFDGSNVDCPVNVLDPNNTAHDSHPIWSPGGSQIAYSSNIEEGGYFRDVWIMNPDGSGRQNISEENDGIDDQPDWGGVPLE